MSLQDSASVAGKGRRDLGCDTEVEGGSRIYYQSGVVAVPVRRRPVYVCRACPRLRDSSASLLSCKLRSCLRMYICILGCESNKCIVASPVPIFVNSEPRS